MDLIRIGAAALVALGITFGLFFMMQLLISMGSDRAANIGKGPVIQFVRLKHDTEVMARKRELPKKEKPPEPPPPPDLQMSQAEAPESETMAFAAPPVDISPDMTGGLNIGGGATDSDSVPIVRVQPVYPMRAQEQGIEGWVVLEFVITEAGMVRNPVVLDSDPPRIFDSAAIRALKKWKYRPRVVDGVPVERTERVRLTFDLDED